MNCPLWARYSFWTHSMPWRRLPMTEEEMAEARADLQARVRMLVDESLCPEVAKYLREKGFNAVYAGDVGLTGKSDQDVAAYAWHEGRILWTHDRDFLDDQFLPEHRNPGVVVLPGGDGDQHAVGVGIAVGLRVFGHGPAIWRKTKSIINAGGEMTIRRRHIDTGKMTTTRYRMTGLGYAEEWKDD